MHGVTTLLLVSHHPLFTNGLSALFKAERSHRVVAESLDGPAALEAAARLEPDVIVVDLIAQVLNGLAMLRQLNKHAPRARIVALSMCTEVSYVSEALRSGASAYVLKSENFQGLLRAVKDAAAGRQYISPTLDATAIRRQAARRRIADPYEGLTVRERQVLQLVAAGRTSAQIAERLGISRRTAETHRANIYKKLLLENSTELVAFALRRGLVTRDA